MLEKIMTADNWHFAGTSDSYFRIFCHGKN